MDRKPNPDLMTTDELVDFLHEANAAYRAGDPFISDAEYDHIYRAELARREPDHPFLHTVEPEQIKFGRRVTHESPMLSTDKAYEQDDVRSYIAAATEAALQVDSTVAKALMFEATPKLDGQAANYDGSLLVTRGDGLHGENISHVMGRLRIYGAGTDSFSTKPLGAGEIVIDENYFHAEIKEQFGMKHPRNFVVGLTGADTLKAHHEKALNDGAVYFVPFTNLEPIVLAPSELLYRFDKLPGEAKGMVPFATDGVVVRVVDERVREVLGATTDFHRWMLAIKEEGESAAVEVLGITAQVGRTGRVTPVLELKPTLISGAEVRRVTAHNFNYVEEKNLNIGSVIKLVRSGEVIPYIADVIESSEAPYRISSCPCCGSALVVEGENTRCTNKDGCRDQVEGTTAHYFETMQNNDLFGPATITKLYDGGYRGLEDIMELTVEGAMLAGFSEKQASNLIEQLARSRTEPVEDWRFLAAFGIEHLGRGDSRKILERYSLDALPDMTVGMLQSIKGFGEKTSPSIVADLADMWPVIEKVRSHGVNLVMTKRVSELASTVGAGRRIVFTGTLSMPRKDAQKMAADAGFIPADSVGKDSILVTGDKVGATKIAAAEKKGAVVITEAQFMDMISGDFEVEAPRHDGPPDSLRLRAEQARSGYVSQDY